MSTSTHANLALSLGTARRRGQSKSETTSHRQHRSSARTQCTLLVASNAAAEYPGTQCTLLVASSAAAEYPGIKMASAFGNSDMDISKAEENLSQSQIWRSFLNHSLSKVKSLT